MFPEIARDDVFRLETERLWLRWPRAADAAALVKLAGDPEVALNTAAIPYPYEKAHAEAAILNMRAQNAAGAGLDLALTFKRQPDEAIGMIGLHPGEEAGEAVFGFWLGRPFWGRGLMTEAAQSLLDLAFGITMTERIVSYVLPMNEASLRVHEKLGFRCKGAGLRRAPARGGDVPAERFELTRGTARTAFAARRPKLQAT